MPLVSTLAGTVLVDAITAEANVLTKVLVTLIVSLTWVFWVNVLILIETCRNTKLDTFFFYRTAKDLNPNLCQGGFELQHLLLCSKLQRIGIRSQEGILKVLKYWKRNTYSALEFLHPNPLKTRFYIYHCIKQREFWAVVTT